MEIAISRRWFVQAGAACWLSGGNRAQAQGQVVKMVVPFTPGTTPDLCARLLGPKLQDAIGRTFVVDNRAGASGMIGMDVVAKAPPDGTTLLLGTSTALTLPFVYTRVPFDVLTGFAPISMIGHTNFALAIHPSVRADTMRDLTAWVKAQAQPPDYASPGKGTFQHLCMEWIGFLTGMKLNHVPYRGSAPAIADLLGGHVKLMVLPLHVAMPLAADGKLVVMGATRRARDPAFPKVPPLAESGVPNLDADAWYAVWGPAGMPKGLVAQYGAALARALDDPDIRTALAKQGITVEPGTPDELLQVSRAEYAKWGALIKDIKLPAE